MTTHSSAGESGRPIRDAIGTPREESQGSARKVMRIIARLNVGGPAIHTVLLSSRMDPAEFDTILVTGMEGASEGSMRHLADDAGLSPRVIPEMGREISWRDDFIALARLISLMRKERPDIICTHTAKAGTLGRIAAILALVGRKRKIFHTFHGHVFHGYFSPAKTRLFILIEQILARFTDRLIAVSENTRQELIGYGVARPEKIAVIPLGLDLQPFASSERHRGELRAELGISESAVTIGLVARLVPIKGIAFFLQAIAALAKSDANIRAVIVGDGELRAALEQQSEELGIGAIVQFLGFRKDLARIYADLDIVALSSLNEGLPVSIIEAMSAARIVVATRVGGVPNLITENETGFLASPADADAFAQALSRAMEARPRWAQIGARSSCRAFALRRIPPAARHACSLYRE